MSKSEFSNRCSDNGFTEEEAAKKAREVDEAHGDGKGKWKKAEIVKDPRGGLMVIIETKE